MEEFTAAAFCAAGAEKVVSNEVRMMARAETGCVVLDSGFGKVRFTAGLAGLYRALMSLRAADRLLIEAGRFPAGDFDALFEGTRAIHWEDFVPRGMALAVSKVRSARSRLAAETAVQAVVHKAAAERLCAAYGIRRLPDFPGAGSAAGDAAQAAALRGGESVGRHGSILLKRGEGAGHTADAGVRVAELRVHIEKDTASVLLDISGEPLFKRGYRPAGGTAPLRESTAAAIILLSGWRRKFPLYDPFCGSGTVVIEAALYAWDQAPGLGRRFALSGLACGDAAVEAAVRQELAEKVDYNRPVCIRGSDTDQAAVDLARVNLRSAMALQRKALAAGLPGPPAEGEGVPAVGGVIPGVEIQCLPMEKARPNFGAAHPDTGADTTPPGFIITNPPYGKRLGSAEEAEARYRDMAVFAKTFPGWKMAVVCNHPGFESHFGARADACHEIKSGAVEAWLYQYERL